MWKDKGINSNLRYGAFAQTVSCDQPLGMEKGWIADKDVTASSLHTLHNDPGRARLHSRGSWKPDTTDTSQVLQVHFMSVVNITSVAIQGDSDRDAWVEQYSLSFSDDTVHWIHDDTTYDGNSDRNTVVQNILKTPQTTRFLQIKPKSWSGSIALRLEIYGCQLESLKCGERFNPMHSRKRRVVGGSEAAPNSWPWMAVLLINGTTQWCGGSLIDPGWILTSAHCFDAYKSPSNWEIRVGEHDLTQEDHHEQVVIAKEFYIHPSYVPGDENFPGDYDVALVRLEKPVIFYDRVHSVCLPDQDVAQHPGTSCYVTGWGDTEYGGERSSVLKQAELKVISLDVCNQNESFAGVINERNLCAGYMEGGVDGCYGDSGGPLVCESSSGIWSIQGLVNWGFECARPKKPGVYINVKLMMPFINAIMVNGTYIP